MGADHDRDHAHMNKFLYGYGNHVGPAYLDGHGYRTIMAYPKSGHRTRINYWSSSDPTVKFRGEFPTGSKYKDNARVITETRFAFAARGDESETCVTTTPAPTTTAT